MLTIASLSVVLGAGPAISSGPTSPPELPPIATSRFAPPADSLRDIRLLGTPAPDPPGGEPIIGDAVEAWTPDRYTMLIFWSPFVGGAGEHLARLGEVTRDHPVDGISIALGPRDKAEAVLADLPGRSPIPPRTIVDPEGAWRSTFLEPLGLTSLPAVVVIDGEGRISYHSPLKAILKPLAQILAGTWDPDAFTSDALEYAARMNLMSLVERGRSLARRGEIEWDDVLSTIREGIALDPDNTPLLVREFDVLLADADRPDEAYRTGRRIMERFPRSPITLNELAWHVVSFPGVSRRDLDFALEASRRANAVQGWMDDGQLDTLARIHWMRGDATEAVRLQRRAAALAPDTWHGDGIRANLDAYTDGSLEPGEMPPPYLSPRRPR